MTEQYIEKANRGEKLDETEIAFLMNYVLKVLKDVAKLNAQARLNAGLK